MKRYETILIITRDIVVSLCLSGNVSDLYHFIIRDPLYIKIYTGESMGIFSAPVTTLIIRRSIGILLCLLYFIALIAYAKSHKKQLKISLIVWDILFILVFIGETVYLM